MRPVLRTLLWWMQYHALSLAHIMEQNPAHRVEIVMKMRAHDARHPTGEANRARALSQPKEPKL